jgi:AhpD family alkylhydroperoxidase
MRSVIRKTAAAAAIALVGVASVPALSLDYPNIDTFWNIQKHFGVVPKFFKLFPEGRLPAMWEAYKAVHLNPDTALDAKTKNLIGLAVAAQARCGACIYFQTSAAFANGASFQEVQEAVAVFAVEDSWSKVLTDETFATVKADTDTLVSIGTLGDVPVPQEPPYANTYYPPDMY